MSAPTPEPTEAELLQRLRDYVDARPSQSAAARDLGVSGTFLIHLLAQHHPIRDSRILPHLGYRRVVTYIPVEPDQPAT